MDITTIILIILGVGIAIGLCIFSWRFENVSNVSEEDLANNTETKVKE